MIQEFPTAVMEGKTLLQGQIHGIVIDSLVQMTTGHFPIYLQTQGETDDDPPSAILNLGTLMRLKLDEGFEKDLKVSLPELIDIMPQGFHLEGVEVDSIPSQPISNGWFGPTIW